jgi:glycosyltransferase involved in cell wall biosynthesis
MNASQQKQLHVMHIMANNSSVPYFNWLAEGVSKYPDVKFSFVCLYPEKPKMIEDMKERGCDCYWIKFDHRKRKSGMIYALLKLQQLFILIKPDTIHSHLFDDSLPALFAAKATGIKQRVITKGDTAFHWNYNRKWVWADRFNNANATHIIALSGEAKQFIIEKERANLEKVYIIHHGIPIEKSTNQKDEYKEQFKKQYGLEGKTVIGTVSRFIEWKGYRYVIEAAKRITEKNKNVKFLFVGHGEQKRELEELVRQKELSEYIQFVGWIEKERMPSLYGVMDIYLHAAYMEPFGLVIAEAMANRVPLVTTKTGAARDVLTHGETCCFIKTKDSQSIAEGITWMLEHPEERNVMKEKVKKLAAEKFNVERMLDDYIKLYRGELRQ